MELQRSFVLNTYYLEWNEQEAPFCGDAPLQVSYRSRFVMRCFALVVRSNLGCTDALMKDKPS